MSISNLGTTHSTTKKYLPYKLVIKAHKMSSILVMCDDLTKFWQGIKQVNRKMQAIDSTISLSILLCPLLFLPVNFGCRRLFILPSTHHPLLCHANHGKTLLPVQVRWELLPMKDVWICNGDILLGHFLMHTSKENHLGGSL